MLSIGNNALAECGRSIVGRLEAGNFIGVGICDPGLETLACLAHKKTIWPSNVSSKELIFFSLQGCHGSFSTLRCCHSKACKGVELHHPSFPVYT